MEKREKKIKTEKEIFKIKSLRGRNLRGHVYFPKGNQKNPKNLETQWNFK